MARHLPLFALLAALPALGVAETAGIKRDKIGIYDLAAIHAIDLKPETISKTEENGIVFEKVRFSSVDNVRVFAILSYKKGATKLPGLMVVDRFRAFPKKVEATNNYFAISVAPPDGNQDPAQDRSVGGPRYQQPFSLDDQFRDNPKQSYVYQHTVALLRALDYLETRPEVDLNKTVVTGYSWPGLMVATLHGLDDRPAAYVLWHGLGYYADENNQSGGQPALFTRKQYEMYGAGTYAATGTKPIYVGVSLDDYFTKLDSVMEVYNNLKCEKAFAYAPNRHHSWTSRLEFDSNGPTWQTHWQFGDPKPPTISEGTAKAEDGKLVYTATVDSKVPLQWSEVLVSYGKPGNWMSRTWHSIPLVKSGDAYRAEIPVYDPAVPMYLIGQIGTEKNHAIGNRPQFITPSSLGITAANAPYPNVLFDPSLKSDLYLRTGDVTWPSDRSDSGDNKGSVIWKPNDGSTVLFNNIEPSLWKGAKELHIWLKGDGKAGPLNAYLAYDANYFLDKDVKNYTVFPLVADGATMSNGWKEYTIPLDKAANLDRVGSLYLEPGNHTLQVGTISWK
ncbi:hypothetical protein [Fimbriimonas ginsengisoli]|uniref:Dipeptidyl aminopeptidase/acylaminoacyl-peptidase-like protein n=1 Tax=Fimbriimonas ginsengisoli Gsoil 348 TaxID=661478 RepID=A0A068NU65_FIMGI|nr:hypothetical protein [Fimbriimonas ginsengisoli]AIE85139.1 Dipeptidyl aminopeptidase/acylaminoacyl-peptidase-like protein [Fimbriimonas ginsengisoli Gsoil 348]